MEHHPNGLSSFNSAARKKHRPSSCSLYMMVTITPLFGGPQVPPHKDVQAIDDGIPNRPAALDDSAAHGHDLIMVGCGHATRAAISRREGKAERNIRLLTPLAFSPGSPLPS
jgi:hypothetical protein